MGSSMDSRYWVCPKCCIQYDWNKDEDEINRHNCVKRERSADATPPDPENSKKLQFKLDQAKAMLRDREKTIKRMAKEIRYLESRKPDADRYRFIKENVIPGPSLDGIRLPANEGLNYFMPFENTTNWNMTVDTAMKEAKE